MSGKVKTLKWARLTFFTRRRPINACGLPASCTGKREYPLIILEDGTYQSFASVPHVNDIHFINHIMVENGVDS